MDGASAKLALPPMGKKRFEEKARSAFLHHLSAGICYALRIFLTASNNIELTGGLEAVGRSSKRARCGEHANRE